MPLGLVAASPVWQLPGLRSVIIPKDEATFYLDSVPVEGNFQWTSELAGRSREILGQLHANVRFSLLTSILDHSRPGYPFSRSSSKLIRLLKAAFARCAIKAERSAVLGKLS